MLRHLVSLATVRLLLRGAPRDSLALMKKLALAIYQKLLDLGPPATAQIAATPGAIICAPHSLASATVRSFRNSGGSIDQRR
jgi:hypothetical protein